jgi:signal transduction histidine kinase
MLWHVAVFGLILIAFAAVVYVSLAESTRAKAESYIDIQSQQLAETYDSGDGLLHPAPSSDIGRGHLGSGEIVLLLAPTGQVKQQFTPLTSAGVVQVTRFARSRSASTDPSRVYTAVLPQETPDGQVTQGHFLLTLTPILVQRQHVATLLVGIPNPYKADEDRLLLILLLAVPATLLVMAGGGYWLAARAMRPVHVLTRTAQEIGATSLHQRLQVSGHDELADLAATFNQMLSRLEAAFAREHQFTADASHELRTPLAIISSESARGLAHRRTVEDHEQILATIQAESAQMGRLVNDLLTLARADAGQGTLRREVIDLSDVTLEAVERMAPLARAQGLTLAAGPLPELTIQGDSLFLGQMLTNLIANAIQHTSGIGTRISVGTSRQQAERECWACVQVADDGPGIAPEHLPHLFDRFYQVDQVRSGVAGKEEDT